MALTPVNVYFVYDDVLDVTWLQQRTSAPVR